MKRGQKTGKKILLYRETYSSSQERGEKRTCLQIKKRRQTCEQNAQNARKRNGAQRGEAAAYGGETKGTDHKSVHESITAAKKKMKKI